MKARDEGTVSIVDDDAAARRTDTDVLVRVLDAARPLAPPLIVPLEGLDTVTLGRGPAAAVRREREGQLRVELADRSVSSTHARLQRQGRAWTLTDEGSKNGTLVNGHRLDRAELTTEDLLELGNSFLLLRRGAAVPAPMPAAFRTLNPALAEQIEVLRLVAPSTVPVLVMGETGTGKELTARAIHEASGRKGALVPVNCGAVPQELMESELFGVRRGAFSGADRDRDGLVIAANNGTLFLDEVAELPEASQAALLRVLQDGEVTPLGSTRRTHVDVRVIAATHRSLDEWVAAGRFRDDLYARLSGHVVTLPPLRARREDLGLLIADLLQRVAGERAAGVTLARAAARALLTHAWPHNIRGLSHVIARAFAMCGPSEMKLAHLPREVAAAAHTATEAEADDRRLVRLLRAHEGNLSAVARALATSRSQVRRRLDREGIDVDDYRPEGSSEKG